MEPKIETLAETENYVIWSSENKEEDEHLFHIELGNITLHFYPEEWEEFVQLMMDAVR